MYRLDDCEITGNSSNEEDLRWYVIYCKPRQESVAKENLERQGFGAYLPLTQLKKRRKGVHVAFVEPFFPRYLFMRFDHKSDDWAPIRSTRGVVGVVKFAGVPQCVPDRLISSLQSNENSDQLQEVTGNSWKAGDVVAIEEGPFAGYSCIYQATKSNDRVRVLLNLIGKQTRATLLKSNLQLPQFA